MLRYRLTNFLNKHFYLQGFIFTLILSLFAVYEIMLFSDMLNTANAMVTNAQLVLDDYNLVEVESYELDGSTAIIDGVEYDNITVFMYGIAYETDGIYFNEVEKVIVQSKPDNFGVLLLLESNTFVVLGSLVVMIILLKLLSKRKETLSLLERKSVFIIMYILTAVLVLEIMSVLLLFL